MIHSLMHFESKSKAVGALRTLSLLGEGHLGNIECALDSQQLTQVEEILHSAEVHNDARDLAAKILELPADTAGVRYFSLSYIPD